jgi:hypothetical protein
MKGDFTRDTFDSTKHYQQVLMQQGRAQLDADWNEKEAIDEHRYKSTTADIVGKCAGPTDGAAFSVFTDVTKLSDAEKTHLTELNISTPLAAGDFFLSAGHYYVHGILCENEWAIPYTAQPDRIDVPALTEDKSYLLYLDVWQRHLTALEDAEIREPALGGPDTATRVKTIWQIRTLELTAVDPDSPCASGDIDSLLDPDTARLTASTAAEQAPDDPCIVPPSGGYKGLENQHYRVEIHDPGAALNAADSTIYSEEVTLAAASDPQNEITVTTANWIEGEAVELYPSKSGSSVMAGQLAYISAVDGTKLTLNVPVKDLVADDDPRIRHISTTWATWKWSRENGSVVTAIEKIDGNQITVSSVGPDANRGFPPDAWVEIIGDIAELEGKPGQLVQIEAVDESSRVITVKSGVTAPATSDRFLKLRRWEGVAAVKYVPDDATNWLALESGIQVRFASGGDYRTGQYWQIPARTATAGSPNGEIEWPLDAANNSIAMPPKGITHHFCRLGIVTVDGQGAILFTDCRCLYPALTAVPRLYYVGGGGQEVSSDAPATNGFYKLPQPLVVGVANAQCLEESPTVRFTVTQGDGRVVAKGGDVTTATNEVLITLDVAGLASCDFYLDPTNWSQQITARLLDSSSSPVSLPITFEANLGNEGESCDCTVCVTAEQHNQNPLAIQQAVDQVLQTGGTICLGPGTFKLDAPVQVSNNTLAVRIRGQGSATIVIAPPDDAAFLFTSSKWCTLDYLAIKTSDQSITASAIRLSNATNTTIERIFVGPLDRDTTPAAVLLEGGILADTRIRENLFQAQVGVHFPPVHTDAALLLSTFYCVDNIFVCSVMGIQLDNANYVDDIVIARNRILETEVAGIYVTGLAICEVDITSNTITCSGGDGIIIGSSGTRVSDNEVVKITGEIEHGIRVMPSPSTKTLDDIVISGNRLERLSGDGITIETRLSAALIEGNILSDIQGNGIAMLDGSAERLNVLNNQITDIDGTITPGFTLEIAGIYLRGVSEGSISSNQVSGIGVNSPTANVIAGIRVESCVDVRISDNTITNIAPASDFSSQASGILINAPLVDIEIADNLIRQQVESTNTDTSDWEAIRIGSSDDDQGGNQLRRLAKLSNAEIVTAISNLAITEGGEQIGIISNSLTGYGGSPLVEVQVSGSCRFSDNYCSSTLSDNAFGVIELSAASLIVSANRVECDEKINALDLTAGDLKNPAGVVLGNIVSGSIQLNGIPLTAPWEALNIQVT